MERIYESEIRRLNALSENLSFSTISLLGLEDTLRDYIDAYNRQFIHKGQFALESKAIETLSLDDKISVFRIIQNFLQ